MRACAAGLLLVLSLGCHVGNAFRAPFLTRALSNPLVGELAARLGLLSAPTPPTFPASYETTYTFSLPFVKVVQTHGLSYPVHAWVDGEGNRMRVDVYDGLDKTLVVQETSYSIYPRINVTICDVSHSTGPTANLLQRGPLPDLSEGWSYSGRTFLAGAPAFIWTRNVKALDKVSTYTFYTHASTGAPLRLYLMGFNILEGSHFDEYLLDFTSYRAGPVDDDAFSVPGVCDEARRSPASEHQEASDENRARLVQAAAQMVWSNAAATTKQGDMLGRRHDVLAEHVALVSSWDASAAGFKLAFNRFSSVSADEYQLLATSKRSSPKSRAVKDTRSLGTLARALPSKQLPRHVDYRGTLDGVVKDQATCGSCWAFSAAGALQGAWHLVTGETVSLSEQQLVDCSWDYGNYGCGGGEMEPAIAYLVDAGGAVAEEDYQYLGQNSFCGVNATRSDAAPSAYFAGYANVKPHSDEALMEALVRYGPVAISIDASQPTFRFYSEGVYKDKRCMTKKGELDHAVLLVGYGTTKDGEDYWLVKNSWSKYWGEDGYTRMARGVGKDCGITTDPVVAIVDPAYYPDERSPAKDGRLMAAGAVGVSSAREIRFEEAEKQSAWEARLDAATVSRVPQPAQLVYS